MIIFPGIFEHAKQSDRQSKQLQERANDCNSPLKESAMKCSKVRDDYIVKNKLFLQEEEGYCASGLLLYRYNVANELEILIGDDDDDDDVC
jgi:hypothetical protein